MSGNYKDKLRRRRTGTAAHGITGPTNLAGRTAVPDDLDGSDESVNEKPDEEKTAEEVVETSDTTNGPGQEEEEDEEDGEEETADLSPEVLEQLEDAIAAKGLRYLCGSVFAFCVAETGSKMLNKLQHAIAFLKMVTGLKERQIVWTQSMKATIPKYNPEDGAPVDKHPAIGKNFPKLDDQLSQQVTSFSNASAKNISPRRV